MPLIVRCDNGIVTDRYLEIIGESLKNRYDNVHYTNNINDALKENRNEVIVVARTIDAFKLVISGFKRVIVWFQGIEPEESFMVHNSKVRYHILTVMERIILKKAVFFIFVSQEMKKHYEAKYRIRIKSSKCYCMPCLNTNIRQETFRDEEKYRNNYFAYVGSMAVWQKFDEIVKAFKKVEEAQIPNSKLFVYTAEKEKAISILVQHNVINFEIGFVKNEELPKVLKKIKYGFIIREDTVVNRVATPTKISTYMSCGLIPVFSTCLRDFATVAINLRYVVPYDENFISKLEEFNAIDMKQIYEEYKDVFDTYYNSDLHRSKLSRKWRVL